MPKQSVDLPDLSQVDLPDPDTDALQSLQHMDDVMRPLIVTPEEERYPPVPTRSKKPSRRKATLATIQSAPHHNRRNNFITLISIILTIGACGYYGLIWTDPQTIVNPLAPPTPFQIVTATVDTNPVFVPSLQPTLVKGQATLTPSLDDLSPFAIAPDGVLYVSNQNGRECNWASIAGSVTNSSNEPLPGFGVRISGDSVSATVFSGTNNTFGEGGYEINLGGAPMIDTFVVQLVTTGGAPLSSALEVTTRDDCNQNVAIVNFVQR